MSLIWHIPPDLAKDPVSFPGMLFLLLVTFSVKPGILKP